MEIQPFGPSYPGSNGKSYRRHSAMRVLGVALLSGVVLLGACGGGESQDAATDSAATAAPVTPAPTGGVSAVAPTGTIHVVNMVGDAAGFRFEPSNITVKPGDGIKFVNVSGSPHNVAFDPATIPADQKDQLFANMPNALDGSSPMFVIPNEEWTLSLGNIKAGKYPFHCTPHLAMNMRGEITVQ
jgi:plastocyanin